MRIQRGQDLDEVDIIIEAAAWEAALPDAAAVAERAAGAALAAATPSSRRLQGRAIEAAILLADDATLRELNRRFRGQDKPTNVLSFAALESGTGPAPEASGPLHLGDVALAFETVAREAAEQGKTLAAHLAHLVVHGLLHLCGHDHQEEAEAQRMEALERDILAGLGVADPYAVESAA